MRVLITGASRGIGRGLLERYRSDGHQAWGTARHTEGLVHADMTEEASLRALSDVVGQNLDLLICNAGIYPDKGRGTDDDFPTEMWARAFKVNVTGVFVTVQSLLPALRRAKGRIAIIASQAGSDTKAPGGAYVYRASKAAVINLGRNLAVDLKDDGIAVGIYHPGWVRTDMGGDKGDLSVEEAADALVSRFDELDLDSTGCFRTWDGRDHPF